MKSTLLSGTVLALAILTQNSLAHRLSQKTHTGVRMMYDESEGPTKVDNGDLDHAVLVREADINEKSEKQGGWTNPLSWSDEGNDDDLVLNMHFDDQGRSDKKCKLPNYTLDDDIIDSLQNERDAEVSVKKSQG